MNGNFKQYVVTYRIAQDNVNERKMSSTTECVLENLEEFTEYYVRVHAETTISGNSSAIKQAKTLEDGELPFLWPFNRISNNIHYRLNLS